MWNDELHDISDKLLFAACPDQSLSLTPDDLEVWSTIVEPEFQHMHTLVTNMLSTLFSQAPIELSLT